MKTTMKDLIQGSRRTMPEIVPDGWQTTTQVAAENNLSSPRARELLTKLLNDGRVEARKFKIPSGCGISHVLHFRPISHGKSGTNSGK